MGKSNRQGAKKRQGRQELLSKIPEGQQSQVSKQFLNFFLASLAFLGVIGGCGSAKLETRI